MKFLLTSIFVTVTVASHYAHGKSHKFDKRTRNPGIGTIGPQGNVDFEAIFNAFDTNLITGPIEEMFKSGYQKLKTNRANANTKIREKLTNTKTKFKAKRDTWTQDHKIAAAGVATSVIGGAGSLINGIRQGDIQTAVSGALGIASAIASVLGPVGSIVGTVLTLVSTIFSFFGGSSAQPKESKEAIMERVVEAALEEHQYDELRKEISGVQYLYSAISSSIANFRRQNEELDEELTLPHGTELYSHAFKELVPFGVLKQYINKFCEAGFVRVVSDDVRDEDDVILYARRCGVLVRLYCSLTIQRQFLLTDLAALLNGDGESEDSDAKALRKISKNVVYMLNREQELDHNFLRFLNDPINYPRRRYAVYRLFEEPHKNKLVVAYLAALNQNFPYYPGFYKPQVIWCRAVMLQSLCSVAENEEMMHDLYGGSLFVPHGTYISVIHLFGEDEEKKARDEAVQVGILGAAAVNRIISSIFQRASQSYVWVRSFKLLYTQDLKNDAQAEVSVCGTPDGWYPANDPDYCRGFEAGSGTSAEFDYAEHDLKTKLFETVKSVNIPANRTVTLYDENDRVVRTFHGPDFIKEVCLPTEWINAKTVKFEKTDNVRQVKVCEGRDLGGKCHNVRMPGHKESVYFNVKDSNVMGGCSFNKIQSMLIPSGMEVQLQPQKDRVKMIGPFVGPITIGHIGFTTDIYDYLKLFDHTEKSIEICQTTKYNGECIVFKESEYPGNDPQFPLSTMQSIKVPSGISLKLYNQVAYGGREVILRGPNKEVFPAPDYAIKSFKVEEISVEESVELDAVVED